ncbi:hypothetical protein IWX76_002741 [Pedobacter sp. CAN_A7]|uniref:hypothetical protein n=1 Tax=Pedobacter sp. CAN_A7 TaxID=2787722 RepID=UPI0018CB852D
MTNKIVQQSKQFRYFLILGVLSLAVIISSCSVRKTLYAQLNIPVTKSLNTSKATLTSNSVCNGVTEVNNLITLKEVKKDVGVLLLTSLTGHPVRLMLAFHKLNWGLSDAKGSDQVPLYILYQNRKIIT